MYELNKGKIPIRSWVPPHEIESGAIDQATNMSNHPDAVGAVVLLPDVHQGYGVPIGCVMALKDSICPSGIGYDIGCGMVAVRTSVRVDELDHPKATKTIMALIRKAIPLGKGGRRDTAVRSPLPALPDAGCPIVKMHLGTAPLQLGTLGGGK